MKPVDVDARRYAWSRGHALWRVSLPLLALFEDMRGGLEAGQDGLVRHNARQLGVTCASVLHLMRHQARPIPPARVRASWALSRIIDEELGEECWTLIRGSHDLSAQELVQRAGDLVTRVRANFGEIPDPLAPDGYFPALALARDHLKLMDAVGVEGFLPKEYTQVALGDA